MYALTFEGKEQVAHQRVADPKLLSPQDVIVEVEACAICGSDLHCYFEREQGMDPGTPMGHEFCGRIVEIGRAVRNFCVGDRVMSPFTTSCGRCFYCRCGLTCRCEQGQLFGWVSGGQGLAGAQAEYVRVPLADGTLLPIPEDISTDLALLLGDILSTGYFVAEQAQIKPDETQVVVGCGPVGLMSIWAARTMGAERLFAIDLQADRLELALQWGAIPIHAQQEHPVDVIRSNTEGRGADAVLEVVGLEGAVRSSFDLLRPGGTLSAVGVCTSQHLPFSPVEAYDKNLHYHVGRCPARHYMERLIELARRDESMLSSVFTQRLPLREGPDAYRRFAARQEGYQKVCLQPR